MQRREDVKQTEYYQQQALACATAALATANVEVRQAYLSLQEGWQSLAPKAKQDPDGAGPAGRRDVFARGTPPSRGDPITDRDSNGDAHNDAQAGPGR